MLEQQLVWKDEEFPNDQEMRGLTAGLQRLINQEIVLSALGFLERLKSEDSYCCSGVVDDSDSVQEDSAR